MTSNDRIDRQAFLLKRDLRWIAIGYKCRITRSYRRKLNELREKTNG
jgi:hypothetical protein